jgi:hypothetical protein
MQPLFIDRPLAQEFLNFCPSFPESFLMRKAYRVTLATAAVVLIYLGWIYYSRWSENREFIRRLAEPKAAQDRAIVDAYGGGRLTILGFYATPAIIRRGAKTQICYGVSNSKTVIIEPLVKNVWPSFSRCVEVAPESDTVYRLIAEDAAGHKEIATTAVKVR